MNSYFIYTAKRTKNWVNYIKKNWWVITVIPLFLGGIYQIGNLLWVGLSFVRFFSTTQLLQDGITILITFFILYALGILQFLLSYDRKNSSENETEDHPSGLISPRIYLFLGTGLFLSITILNFPFDNFLQNIYHLSITLGLTAALVVLILRSLKLISKNFFDKIWGFSKVLFFVGILFSAIYFMYYLNNIGKNSTLFNLNFIDCLVESEPFPIESYEVLYFNDKYIFLELIYHNERKVRILPFETFFDPSNCIEKSESNSPSLNAS